MREGAVRCLDPHGFHWMRYTEWGDSGNPRKLVCVHGLTRTGRDFDTLAERLCDAYHVLCPDIAGRGRSDWLRVPRDYTYQIYGTDIATLIAKIGAETVDWVGTSMGGILGMILGSMPGTPVRRLVVNDVGCLLPQAALERIGKYVGAEPVFDSLEALEAAMKSVSPFGELTAGQWRHLAIHVAREEQGKWKFRYDPGIAVNFRAVPPGDIDLRHFWTRLPGPVLIVRGDQSDLLPESIAREMLQRAHTSEHVVARCGHAPMLMDDAQVGAVRHFLLNAE